MRLSAKDRSILSFAELNANASAAALGRLTGYREHTVRYTLDRLRDEGIIMKRCFIDLFRLGYLQFEVFLRLDTKRTEVRAEFAERLRKLDHISWMGEFGGDFDFAVNVCATHIADVASFIENFLLEFPDVFIEKAIAARLSLTYFGNKHLAEGRRPVEELRYEVTKERVAIDELDHRILRALVEGSSRSRRQLAQMLQTPLSTLELRIRRLQDKGVIRGFYHWVKPERLSMHSFLFLVSVKGFSQDFKTGFHKFCANHPNIIVLINAVGSWDFEVAVEVERLSDARRIADQMSATFGKYLNSLKIVPSFGYPKLEEYPFQEFRSQSFDAGSGAPTYML